MKQKQQKQPLGDIIKRKTDGVLAEDIPSPGEQAQEAFIQDAYRQDDPDEENADTPMSEAAQRRAEETERIIRYHEEFQKREKQRVWRSARVPLLVAALTVILYEIIENRLAVMSSVKSFLSVLTPVFVGIVLAYIINFPLRFLENKVFKKWKACSLKRGVCMAIGTLFILGIIAAFLFLIVPRVVDSLVTLVGGLEGYFDSLAAWASELWEKLQLDPNLEQKIQTVGEDILSELDTLLSSVASGAAKFTLGLANTLFDAVFAVVISVYALFKKEKFIFQTKKVVVAIFSKRRASSILEVAARTNEALHNYFYGMIIECTILGVLCFIAMTVFNFPYALLISTVIGVTQIVPIIGPWVGTIFGALIIFVIDPTRAIWFVVLELAVQQVEANVFYPRVVGNAVGLSGIWVMIAVILGGGLFGFVGVVLCMPVMAVLYTLVSEWVNRRVEEKRFAAGMRETPPTEEEISELVQQK